MDRDAVEAWLSAYGGAWERRDGEAFAQLFSPDVLYYWTPLDEPKRGREMLRAAVEAATSRQRDIRFAAELLALTPRGALAHWSCSFDRVPTGQRVNLDGIFWMEFSEEGLCRIFREWWHSDE